MEPPGLNGRVIASGDDTLRVMTDPMLKARLHHDLHDSIRARDKVRSATLRMALTAVTTAEVAGEQVRELGDDEVLAVLAKEAKKRKEASVAYRGAGRVDLADTEDAELRVLEGYLPAQLTDSELRTIVERVVASSGASSISQMGAAMRAVQIEITGRADGGRVAAIVRDVLTRGTPD
jgi:uncharacterized protein